MLVQFRDRYPTGSLTTKLLQIHDGQYVVQAQVQIDGVILASGLAAAATIELAEDRSSQRALEGLGMDFAIAAPSDSIEEQPIEKLPQRHLPTGSDKVIEKSSPISQDTTPNRLLSKADGVETSQLSRTKKSASETAAISANPSSSAFSPVNSNTAAVGNGKQAITADGADETIIPGQDSVEQMSLQPQLSAPSPLPNHSNPDPKMQPQAKHSTQPGSASRATVPEDEMNPPVDLSDAIAKTSVELKRLKWSNEQGREYLKTTYNKLSRQRLTDEELLDFLHYLEALPSPPG